MLWIGGQNQRPQHRQNALLAQRRVFAGAAAVPELALEGQHDSSGNGHGGQSYLRTLGTSVFAIGLGSLLFVPILKTLTHLPPFMGMLLMLGVMWVVTELIHNGKDEVKGAFCQPCPAQGRYAQYPVGYSGGSVRPQQHGAFGRIGRLARPHGTKPNFDRVADCGCCSSVVDNVPLVAAAQGMYTLDQFPTDHFFWEFLAYTTGTGGSALIISCTAGVAAMGIEKIDFFWYVHRWARALLRVIWPGRLCIWGNRRWGEKARK